MISYLRTISGENIANEFIMLYVPLFCCCSVFDKIWLTSHILIALKRKWGQKQIMVHGFVYFK